ncbi:hypothetical protein D9M69_502380 [compost metagenome]
MQVHVAGVLDRAVVEVALQQIAHLVAVEQADLVAHATVHRLFVILAQAGHVRGFVCGVQVAVLEVAGDAVFFHALPDDLVPAPAQVPDEIIDFITNGAAHLFAHGFIARQAAGDLAAIAPGGAPADLVGLDDGYLVAAFGQFHGAGYAGEAAADDGDVDADAPLQARVVGFLVERGAVIGGAALGGGDDGFECSGHSGIPWSTPLTPTLSRRARGRAVAGMNPGYRSAPLPPLPLGEGWGEGWSQTVTHWSGTSANPARRPRP